MLDFSTIILEAISNYKLILRKNLTATQCTAKLRELELKRKSIRKTDEIGLYNLGLKIIGELKKDFGDYQDKRASNFYYGAGEFLQYLEKVYAHYRIENNQVIHVRQMVSCALVEAIQLISLSKEQLTGNKMLQVMQYGDTITTYGTEEQKKMFFNVIDTYQKHLLNKFTVQNPV